MRLTRPDPALTDKLGIFYVSCFRITPAMRANLLEDVAGVSQFAHLLWRAEAGCVPAGEDCVDHTRMAHKRLGARTAQRRFRVSRYDRIALRVRPQPRLSRLMYAIPDLSSTISPFRWCVSDTIMQG